MTTTIRFPYPSATSTHASEADQIIELVPATGTLRKGGELVYKPVTIWRNSGRADEAPYEAVVIEFTAPAAVGDFTIGDGLTERIGLYGQVGSARFLLGVLGISLGSTAPQIPMVFSAAAVLVGYAQVVCNVAAYDALSVGSVGANIAIAENVIVTARPIRRRFYGG